MTLKKLNKKIEKTIIELYHKCEDTNHECEFQKIIGNMIGITNANNLYISLVRNDISINNISLFSYYETKKTTLNKFIIFYDEFNNRFKGHKLLESLKDVVYQELVYPNAIETKQIETEDVRCLRTEDMYNLQNIFINKALSVAIRYIKSMKANVNSNHFKDFIHCKFKDSLKYCNSADDIVIMFKEDMSDIEITSMDGVKRDTVLLSELLTIENILEFNEGLNTFKLLYKSNDYYISESGFKEYITFWNDDGESSNFLLMLNTLLVLENNTLKLKRTTLDKLDNN